MSCLASVSRDYLGVERCKPVGDVGTELYAWFRPVVGVVIGAGLAIAPESSKRLGMDGIDQAGESGLVGLIAEVPFGSLTKTAKSQFVSKPGSGSV